MLLIFCRSTRFQADCFLRGPRNAGSAHRKVVLAAAHPVYSRLTLNKLCGTMIAAASAEHGGPLHKRFSKDDSKPTTRPLTASSDRNVPETRIAASQTTRRHRPNGLWASGARIRQPDSSTVHSSMVTTDQQGTRCTAQHCRI